MKDQKPLVIFVFSLEGSQTSTRYGGFAKRLQKAGGLKSCEVLTVALENLIFVISENGEADVIDSVSGRSMGDASLVYMKSRWGLPEEASTLANYLFYKGIPFMDSSALGAVMSKIATIVKLWGKSVPVPFTLYTKKHEQLIKIIKLYHEQLGERFILKDAKGAKGKINFYITAKEVPAILKQYPDVQFIVQRFVPNAGDYRIGVYAGVSSFVIKRVGNGHTHLNNTSAGGEASYIETNAAPVKLLRLAEKASRAVDLQISGVDIIVDKETGKPYILEVNQGSQIVTGAFVEQNIAAFNVALEQAVRGRYIRNRKQPTKVVGRRAVVSLKLLGIKQAVAKVDTGAYSSTLHAENILVRINAQGVRELTFNVAPSQLLSTIDGKMQTITATEFFDQKVRSSNGVLQHRYSIKTRISIEGRVFSAILTLSDRSEMGYPLLIGRKLLRSRFVVNVELNERKEIGWKY